MTTHDDESAEPIALTCEQSRRVDELALSQLRIPTIVLMENAAINAANALMDMLEIERQLKPFEARVNIFCGGGNNGGDGYAMARHLHNWGADVHLYAMKPLDALKGDAAINATICSNMQLPIMVLDTDQAIQDAVGASHQADAVVDALLGTGFQGTLRPAYESLLQALADLQTPLRLAVDIPSGLDGDSGEAAAACFRADMTVTFVAPKVGFKKADAATYLGRLVVADIGIPNALIDQVAGT